MDTDCKHAVADALRKVAERIERASFAAGTRAPKVDMDDLVRAFVAVAEELDPPVPDKQQTHKEA
jgi:hypothetical protein